MRYFEKKKRVEEIIEDRDLRQKMSIRCKKKAMKYSFQNYSHELLRVLN